MEYEDNEYCAGELNVTDSDRIKFAKIAEMAYDISDNVCEEYHLVVDEAFSNNEGLVLIDNTNNHIIISIRGSAAASDFIVSDLAVVLGHLNKSPRYRRERARLIRVKEKYPTRLIDLTGHSLGGSLCVALTYDLPAFIDKCIAYNPGFSFADVKKSFINKLKSKLIPSFLKSSAVNAYDSKIKIYRKKGDPVSLLSRFDSNTETINKTGINNPHTIENFTSESV